MPIGNGDSNCQLVTVRREFLESNDNFCHRRQPFQEEEFFTLQFRFCHCASSIPDGFSWRLPAVQNGVNLLGNRHLNMAGVCQADRSRGCEHPLGNHAVHVSDNLRQCSPSAKFNANSRLRERPPVQVRTRSPKPAKPAIVSARPPQATTRRVISARPRVINAATELCPKPRPSQIPAAIATTFLSAPPVPRQRHRRWYRPESSGR